MKCPACQTVNADHRSFCKRCGGRIRQHCPQCVFANEMDDAYCGGCGAALSGVAPVPPRGTQRGAPQPNPSNPASSLLANLLKEEPVPVETDTKETKKGINQEEIDKLFSS